MENGTGAILYFIAGLTNLQREWPPSGTVENQRCRDHWKEHGLFQRSKKNLHFNCQAFLKFQIGSICFNLVNLLWLASEKISLHKLNIISDNFRK